MHFFFFRVFWTERFNVKFGLIHPPVGMNLFVIQAQAPDVRIANIYRGVTFLIAPLALIVILFPSLVLWLPKLLYG